ncbi:MAG TPA: hypothetical protein VJS69_00870, partial [Candidatus Krumholzibacteria bacterium]|nr:hypothetical protein [Candidatus Krumholzibacteria bacterium]
NVYRGGSSLRLEVSRGVAITNDNPISVPVGCIAENGKRVAVDLYVARVLAYHGFNADVDVVAGKSTGVSVEASKFFITDLTLTPQVIPSGAAFTLHWPSAPAAQNYRVEESATADFATVTSSQTAVDTTLDVHLGQGSHFFRVRPVTPYAQGPASPERFGYVTAGSNQVKVLSVSNSVIPLETITITGENLDFPDTHALMGPDTLTVESVAWGELVARVPRTAHTNKVTVTSSLGTNTSGKEVTVERIAYVTALPTSTTTTDYVKQIENFDADVDRSGVAVIPLSDLDRRDMSVFDVIVVAADTGTLKANWGGTNQGQRVSAIAETGANVLAIGRGGVSFLQNTLTSTNLTYTSAVDGDRQYYEPNQNAAVFDTPHSVGGGANPTFCTVASTTVALDIASSPAPASTSLYASTDKTCLIGCTPNDKWALADFRFNNAGGSPVIYFFWGYAGAPNDLSADGKNCLGNVVYLLYKN